VEVVSASSSSTSHRVGSRAGARQGEPLPQQRVGRLFFVQGVKLNKCKAMLQLDDPATTAAAAKHCVTEYL
jgi:hypothetical protein